MPMPKYRNTETGLTGRFRVRRQAFSGLSILQVEVSVKRSRYPLDSSNDDIKTMTDWRDSTYEEAIRIQIDYGG